jgi:hypothetical protein
MSYLDLRVDGYSTDIFRIACWWSSRLETLNHKAKKGEETNQFILYTLNGD